MPSWKKVVVSGSDATLNSLFVSTAVTASIFSGSFRGNLTGTASYVTGSVFNSNNLALSSSYALTASYALNGGGGGAITIADEGTAQGTATFLNFIGSGVQAVVASNTASITITGGAATGSVALHTQAVAANTWSFVHNLGNDYPVVNVWDSNGFTVIPGGIKSVDENNLQIYFDIAQAGYASAVVGGVAVSSSFATNATSASYALTASYLLGTVASSTFPYTGSAIISGSLIVTGSISISGALDPVNYIQFNRTASVTDAVGRLYFDSGEGTARLGLNGGNVIANIGEDLFQYAYNASGGTLSKGQVVYISGSQGNRVAVKLASNSAEQGSANTLGFVAESIAAGGEGWIQTEGTMRQLNTTGLTAGQLIFLGATPGTYTQSIPLAPSHSVRLGYVERVDATVGSIYIKIDNGYETDELHDVLLTNATTGDLFVRSGSVWINSKQLTGSYGLTGSLTVTGSIRSNGGFTGSLFGTASYVTGSIFSAGNLALSSSYSITSSNANTASRVNSDLTQGTGITSFTYNGSSAQSVAVAGASTLTTNELTKWTGTAFADSNIFDNGTNVFITASNLIVSGASSALIVTGSVRSSGGFTGSLFGTASYVTGSIFSAGNLALSASYAVNGGVTSFNTRTGAVTLQASDISGLGAGIVSASAFSSPSQGTLRAVINGVQTDVDLGLQTTDNVTFGQVTGSNALFSGTITAQTLVVQTVTSSVDFVTGSTRFGSLLTDTHRFTGSVSITGSLSVSGVTLINTQQNATINTGTSVVATVPTSSYNAAFFDYVARSGSATQNLRAGTITSVWNTTGTVEYTDVSTVDIGTTAGVTLAVVGAGANAELRATVTTDSWNIKTFVRAI